MSVSARLGSGAAASRGTVVAAIGLPSTALALGGLGILLARQGAASRPALAGVVLATGALAALLPLRHGIAVAIVLGTFNGFWIDLVGSRASYWNEVFVALLVARTLFLKRPTRVEIGTALVIAAVFALYLLESSAREVYWGAKVLLASVFVGWAVARLRPDARVWRWTFFALCVVVGSQVTMAAWERRRGIAGLHELGLADPDRVKQGPGDTVRAFGALVSPAAFSYVLAIALLVWVGLLLAGRVERSLALATCWVPAAVFLGIFWSFDRTAFLALAAAAAAVALRAVRRPLVLGAAAAAVVLVVVVASTTMHPARAALRDGVVLHSTQARGRLALWRLYLDELTPFGAGPASAGGAYYHVASGTSRVRLKDWRFRYTRGGTPVFEIGFPGGILIDAGRRTEPLTIVGQARAYPEPRPVTVRLHRQHGRATDATRVGTEYRPFTLHVPPLAGSDRVYVDAGYTPAPAPGRAYLLSLQIENLHVEGLPPASTKAQAVYERFLGDAVRPGVVDNLYVSWLFQYGLVGVLLCGAWLAVLLKPFRAAPGDASRALAARLIGVFLVVAALAVNIWEEAPVDLIAALVIAQTFAIRERSV